MISGHHIVYFLAHCFAGLPVLQHRVLTQVTTWLQDLLRWLLATLTLRVVLQLLLGTGEAPLRQRR